MRHRSGRSSISTFRIHSVPYGSIVDGVDGEFVHSSYWETELAAGGRPFLSVRLFSIRLLLPAALEASIPRMLATPETFVSRGPWPARDRENALEFLFDDGRAEPLTLRFGMELADRWPPDFKSGTERTLSFRVFDPTCGRMAFEKPKQVGSRRGCIEGCCGSAAEVLYFGAAKSHEASAAFCSLEEI